MIQQKETKPIKKNKMSVGKAMAIGAGVAALGAGAYYFLGPNAKKNQAKAKIWMGRMEKEVAQKMGTIENVSEPIYHQIVDNLAQSYSKQYKEHAPQIKAFAEHLKSAQKGFEKKTKPASKKAEKK